MGSVQAGLRTHHINHWLPAIYMKTQCCIYCPISHTITCLEQKIPSYRDTNLLTFGSSLDSIIMLRSLTTADTFSSFQIGEITTNILEIALLRRKMVYLHIKIQKKVVLILLTTIILKIAFLKLQFVCMNSFFHFKSNTIILTRRLE